MAEDSSPDPASPPPIRTSTDWGEIPAELEPCTASASTNLFSFDPVVDESHSWKQSEECFPPVELDPGLECGGRSCWAEKDSSIEDNRDHRRAFSPVDLRQMQIPLPPEGIQAIGGDCPPATWSNRDRPPHVLAETEPAAAATPSSGSLKDFEPNIDTRERVAPGIRSKNINSGSNSSSSSCYSGNTTILYTLRENKKHRIFMADSLRTREVEEVFINGAVSRTRYSEFRNIQKLGRIDRDVTLSAAGKYERFERVKIRFKRAVLKLDRRERSFSRLEQMLLKVIHFVATKYDYPAENFGAEFLLSALVNPAAKEDEGYSQVRVRCDRTLQYGDSLAIGSGRSYLLQKLISFGGLVVGGDPKVSAMMSIKRMACAFRWIVLEEEEHKTGGDDLNYFVDLGIKQVNNDLHQEFANFYKDLAKIGHFEGLSYILPPKIY